MFFDINIPVVPIEIWLRVTHNQRQKTLKVASVLLFRHILKTKRWLECGFSLLNSRMWPGILRDAAFSNMHLRLCPWEDQAGVTQATSPIWMKLGQIEGLTQ